MLQLHSCCNEVTYVGVMTESNDCTIALPIPLPNSPTDAKIPISVPLLVCVMMPANSAATTANKTSNIASTSTPPIKNGHNCLDAVINATSGFNENNAASTKMNLEPHQLSIANYNSYNIPYCTQYQCENQHKSRTDAGTSVQSIYKQH